MAVINSELIQLSDEQRCQVASWLVDFDRSWNESRLAARARELPAGTALRRAVLIEMIKIDLEKQWQLGRRPTVESYLALYPELGTPGNAPVDLIQAEYEVRMQFGVAADLAEIARRFPGQAEQLQEAVTRSRQLVKDTELGDPAQPTRAPAASTLPEQFGRYRILQPLGQGGMGAVYLAEDTLLHRKVALKVPHFGPNASSQLHERFVREAKAAAAFDHPNLCPVYDVGCIDGVHYLTMRFIDGKSLGAFIHPDKPLPVRTVLALVRKVALALAEAHQKGIVHRDLKPSNIMINARKEPVVMDFGLVLRSTEEARITQSGAIIGTPAYMAPEQVSGQGDRIGPACDVYSLGVILYEMLTGHLPFKGPGMAILAQILTTQPLPPTHLRPDLDARLSAVCLKALAKKIEDRYPTMTAFAAALNQCLQGAAGPATPAPAAAVPLAAAPVETAPFALAEEPVIAAAWPKPGRARQQRRPMWPWLVAGAAAAALLLGLVLSIDTGNGTVKIELNEPNAQVAIKVDGKVITLAGPDGTITVRPGEHDLEVSGPNFQTFTKKYTAIRGQTSIWSVELQPKTAVATAGPPSTTATSTPARPERPTDYQALAPGKWQRVFTDASELPVSQTATLKGEVLELNSEKAVIRTRSAKNAILRAQVKQPNTGYFVNAMIWMRTDSPAGSDGYGAYFNGGNWFGLWKRVGGKPIDLKSVRTPQSYRDYFEFAIAAVGDTLTVYVDGRQILQVKDSSLSQSGFPAVSASRCRCQFKQIEVQLLDEPAPVKRSTNAVYDFSNPQQLDDFESQVGRWEIRDGALFGTNTAKEQNATLRLRQQLEGPITVSWDQTLLLDPAIGELGEQKGGISLANAPRGGLHYDSSYHAGGGFGPGGQEYHHEMQLFAGFLLKPGQGAYGAIGNLHTKGAPMLFDRTYRMQMAVTYANGQTAVNLEGAGWKIVNGRVKDITPEYLRVWTRNCQIKIDNLRIAWAGTTLPP